MIPLSVIIAGAMIAGAVYFSNVKSTSTGKDNGANQPPTVQNSMRPVSSSDHILGNPNAELLMVEYSDTECPYCKQFHSTLQRVMAEYGTDGKVAWVYRHFPIDQLHKKARKEAEAAECAGDQGGGIKFWEYLNMIYDKTTSNDTLDLAQLPVFAKNIGLDVNKFNECLNSGKFAAKIQADYQDAVAAGGQGTPHTIIISKDGTKTPVQGAYPYEQLKPIIDALLQK